MFPVYVSGPVVEVLATAVERLALVAFERHLHTALMKHVLQCKLNVIGESRPVADVVQYLGGLGGIALIALHYRFGIVQEYLGITDVIPGVGRIDEDLVGIQELADSETGSPKI